jgi:hypothetical protein
MVTVEYPDNFRQIQDIMVCLCLTFRPRIRGKCALSYGSWKKSGETQSFSLHHLEVMISTAHKQCDRLCQQLLSTAVIATVPPVSNRGAYYIDMDFDEMKDRAGTTRNVLVSEHVVWVGRSTALIPVSFKEGTGQIIWHLEKTRDINRLLTELLDTHEPYRETGTGFTACAGVQYHV